MLELRFRSLIGLGVVFGFIPEEGTEEPIDLSL
jgi:hypothetical protein